MRPVIGSPPLICTNSGRIAGRRHILCGSSRWIAIPQIDGELLPHFYRLFHLSMCLHKFVTLFTSSVPVRKFCIEQMFVSVRMQFHSHADTASETFRQGYAIPNLECCKCATMIFHCANALVVLRICAPQREHWSPGSLLDLITTAVNLNRKLVYLSSTRKSKFFKDTCRRKHSFIFPMSEQERMFSAKRQLQTTKWKNTKTYCKTWRSSKPDLTISKS